MGHTDGEAILFIMNQTLEYNWNVLVVKPNAEKKVGQQLKELGFETCVPIQKQLRQWSDRKKLMEVVLFKNYVFVATNAIQRKNVFQVGNVIRYLTILNKPSILRPNEVTLIKKLSNIDVPVTICFEKFQIADTVEIIYGPLSGHRGKVIGMNGKHIVQLSLPNLNCFANVQLNSNELQLVDMLQS